MRQAGILNTTRIERECLPVVVGTPERIRTSGLLLRSSLFKRILLKLQNRIRVQDAFSSPLRRFLNTILNTNSNLSRRPEFDPCKIARLSNLGGYGDSIFSLLASPAASTPQNF